LRGEFLAGHAFDQDRDVVADPVPFELPASRRHGGVDVFGSMEVGEAVVETASEVLDRLLFANGVERQRMSPHHGV
jgi:hypothetical protein